MSDTRQSYSSAFKAEAVRTARSSDRPVAEVARELNVNPRTLRGWVAAAERAEQDADPAAARAEIAALRAEVERLRAELAAKGAAPSSDAYRLRRR